MKSGLGTSGSQVGGEAGVPGQPSLLSLIRPNCLLIRSLEGQQRQRYLKIQNLFGVHAPRPRLFSQVSSTSVKF